ncbi:MAG: Fic family protein [Actinomycetota bacterium]|nr:Fic family protein [Actinomycetota bacterium]
MAEGTYLSLEDLFGLVRALGAGPVRDVGLLESAAARPRTSLFGEDAYPSIEGKAAALLHSLARNHPLVDGNRRLAWLATTVFLDLSGYRVGIDHDGAFDLVMAAAQGEIDAPEIALRLQVSPY